MAGSETTRRRFTWVLPALSTVAVATAAAAGASAAQSGPVAKIVAFKPVADTYVTAVHPRRNFGRARILRVDGAPETTTYLRFELRKLQVNATSVTLLLRASTAARARFAVRRVNEGDWRERRLTYANAPRPSARYAASKPVRIGVWSAIDVTPFVNGSSAVTLAITTRGTSEVSFGSRESKNGPRLVVQTDEDEGDLDDLVREALLPH